MMAVGRARQGFLTCRRLGSSECALDALREFIMSERDALSVPSGYLILSQ